MPSLFIDDSFTWDFELPPRRGLPALRGQFRQALAEEVLQYQADVQRAPGRESARITARFLARHLVGWDAPDPKKPGEPAPCTEELIRKLPLPDMQRLLDIVASFSPATPQIEAELGNSSARPGS